MVKDFFRNGTSILFRRQSTILSAAVIMMVLTLASRILGLARNWFLARYFGAGASVDAFNVALSAPDLLANVLIAGALSVSFIPIFTTYLDKEKKQEAWNLASSVLNFSLLFYLVFGLVIFLFPAQINFLAAPGLKASAVPVAANLTRIIVFGELILLVGIFLTSVLQSFHRFLAAALAPVFYNLGILFGVIVLGRFYGIYGVGFGVVIGAVLHVLVQILVAGSLGFKFNLKFDRGDPAVVSVIKLSLPRALTVGLGQLEWQVSVFLGSLLSVGSVSVLKYASDLQNLPIGLFGLSIATAALPTLAVEWSGQKIEEFKSTFVTSLHNLLYLAVPLSFLFIVLRIPIVRLVLGSGQFGWPATVATATTLSFYAVGIFAEAAFLLTARAFYAMHDTLTPLRVAIAALGLHAFLSIFFIVFLAAGTLQSVAYLGLASSFSGTFSFLVSLLILEKRVGGFGLKRLLLPIVKIFIASSFMALVLYLPLHLNVGGKVVIDYIINTQRTLNLLFLTSFVSVVGLATYLLLTWWFGSEELKSYLRLIPDLNKLWKQLLYEEPVDSTHTPN